MQSRDIVLCAIKAEAKQKPNQKIVIGQKIMTYRELASKVEARLTKKKLPKQEKQFIESFIQNSVTLFETSPTFRTKMLELTNPAK